MECSLMLQLDNADPLEDVAEGVFLSGIFWLKNIIAKYLLGHIFTKSVIELMYLCYLKKNNYANFSLVNNISELHKGYVRLCMFNVT